MRQLVDGLDHPEGVAYDPDAGVVWAGGEAGQIYRVPLPDPLEPTDQVEPDPTEPVGGFDEVARAPGFVLGLAVDGRGRLAICVSSDGSVCVYDGEEVRRVVNGLVQPNYPAFGPDGTLYVSDSGTWAHNDGQVVRVDVDGAMETLTQDAPFFTNGLAVSADGRHLYVVESYEPRLSRIDLHTGRVELLHRFDGTVLDGLAFTDDGRLLVSCYRPDRIYLYDGTAEIVADDPQGTILSAPTNVCFVGPQLDRVVSANLGRWHLTLLDDLGLRGAALHRPERWAA